MPKITQLYAFVMADADEDDEGIPAFRSPSGVWMPMVGADVERVDSLRSTAQAMSNAAHKPVKVLVARELELVETIEPMAASDG